MASMDFTIQDPQGQEQVVDDQHVVNELKRMGHDVQGVSADGQTLSIGQADAKGKQSVYQVPTTSALQALGHNVVKALPAASDASAIHPMWGAELQSLPQVPEARKAFLEAKLRSAGIEDPQVVGHGDEYHVFDPATSKWHQVTESPGWNKTGAISAGLALPHLLGMGVGGTVGAAAGTALGGLFGGGAGGAAGAGVGAVPGAVAGGGVGAVAGGMAGAGVGSALGEGARQAMLSGLDSDYAKVAGDNLSEEAWNAAKTGGYDALAHGGGALLGKVLPRGLVSKAVGTAGRGLEAVGSGVKTLAGKIAGSDMASGFVGDSLPLGVGQASMVGQLAQLPQAVISGGAKMMAGLPDSKVLSPLFGDETSAKIGQYGRDLLESRAPQGYKQGFNKLASDVSSSMGGDVPGAGRARAADVMENAAARMKAAAKYDDPASGWLSEEQAQRDATKAAWEGYGATPEDVGKISDSAAGDMRRDAIRMMAQGESSPAARAIGRAIDGLGDAGRSLEGGIVKTAKTGLRGVQGLGAAAEYGGNALANAATIAQPLELPASLRYGLPTVKNWWEESRKRR